MKLHLLILPVIILLIISCNQKPASDKLDEENYNNYLRIGNELSGQAQSVLLSNVSGAIKKGGTVYAVEFCNLEASGITDSLNNLCNCSISRISAKNRNPKNVLSTDIEHELWEYFLLVNQTELIHDTVVIDRQRIIYYKPILTSMQACLQCHGPVVEIDKATYDRIEELYPDDKAMDYELNELRGMWKIEFKNEEGTETTPNVVTDNAAGGLNELQLKF